MLAAKIVERFEQGRGRHRHAVDRNAIAALEIDGDIFRACRARPPGFTVRE
jgi:hypothetical protein